MTRFISIYRLTIAVFGVMAAIAFFLLSRNSTDTLWSNWLLDMSASSLTITITALLVDLLLNEEREARSREATAVILDEIDSTFNSLTLAIGELFGYQRAQNKLPNYMEVRKYIDNRLRPVPINTDHPLDGKLSEAQIETFYNSIKRIDSEIEAILPLCNSHLDSKIYGKLLVIRRHVKRTKNLTFGERKNKGSGKDKSMIVTMVALSTYAHLKDGYLDALDSSVKNKVLSYRYGGYTPIKWKIDDAKEAMKKWFAQEWRN